MLTEIISYFIIALYTMALASVTFYCLLQFHLLYQYRKGRKRRTIHELPAPQTEGALPMVTIQLPLYNERYVAGRLLENITRICYPKDRLEIQVLDDSTDETTVLCKQMVENYRQQGYDIHYCHRSSRTGFKAGALGEGLAKSKGALIAIFDADFLPGSDFLMRTVPYFNDPVVGVVQTRWGHINEDYSLITRLQAFQLNVHFTIEQGGRQSGGYLLQFNGTSGVWRREAIMEAGGWQSDTLTEDLDLSYRAQLKGWKIIYRQDIAAPGELPFEMSGLKSQQFRWMKGGAENARKLIPAIFRSEMPLMKKLHASTHLLSSTVFVFVFLLAVLSVPALFLVSRVGIDIRWYGMCMIGMLTTGVVYYIANKDTAWIQDPMHRQIIKFFVMFPLFLSLSMGLSLHNSIAVVQGYMGRKSIFVRTPKFNIQHIQDSVKKGIHEARRVQLSTIIEGMLALYFLVAVIMGLEQGKTSFLLYHLMLMFGFGGIFIYSVKRVYHP